MKGLIFVVLLAAALTIASAAIPRPRITNNFEVALKIYADDERIGPYTLVCGGALISPEWIVTAGDCMDGAESITAFLGSTKKGSSIKTEVLETIIGSEDNEEADLNITIIALLRIAPVTLGPNINIVNLPPLSSSSLAPSYLFTKSIAAVWGKINDNGEPIEELQYAHMRIVPDLVCSQMYGVVNPKSICALTKLGTSACPVENSGPLVTESTNTLIGVTNTGSTVGCGLGIPVVFTRISSYRSWILEKTGV